jgi:hypothetical protein
MKVNPRYLFSSQTLFICILTLTFFFVLTSVSFGDDVTVTLSVNGNSHTEKDGNVSDSGTTTKLNGGTLKYEIDISEYQPWISNMRISVSCSNCDRNERVKGYVWANFSVKESNQDTYDYANDLTNTSSTEMDFWTSSITSPSSYMDSKDDGGYKITVKVYAKKGITDHAEAKIYKVKAELHLNYNKNTL